MQTIYELQMVKTMDKQTIELLLPFVCVKVVEDASRYPSLKTILKYGKQEVLTRMDVPFYTRKGYEKTIWDLPFIMRCVMVFVTGIICKRE